MFFFGTTNLLLRARSIWIWIISRRWLNQGSEVPYHRYWLLRWNICHEPRLKTMDVRLIPRPIWPTSWRAWSRRRQTRATRASLLLWWSWRSLGQETGALKCRGEDVMALWWPEERRGDLSEAGRPWKQWTSQQRTRWIQRLEAFW